MTLRPKHCHFLKHPQDACPDTRGSKVFPVVRGHVLMHAAAAALDARFLQTSANNGDGAAWSVCNDSNNWHEKVSDFIAESWPEPHTTRNSKDVRRNCKDKPHKPAPRRVVAQRCATPFRQPSAAAATTASSLRAAGPAPSRRFGSPCHGLTSLRCRRVPLRPFSV